MAYVRALPLDDMWVGDMVGCRPAGVPVLLVRLADGVHAYADACPHLGIALSEGALEGGVLTCAGHQWQFDAATGQGVNPAMARLTAYATRVEGGEVYVDLPAEGRP